MSSDHEIIRNLTKAGVPRSCWNVSSKGTGRLPLKEFAVRVKDRMATRAPGTCGYIRGDDFDTRVMSIEISAKELVLAGVRTKYITFNKLTRDLRLPDFDDERVLSGIYGFGALVVPEIPAEAKIPSEQLREYHETVEYLVNHVYEGGVLITSGTPAITKKMRSCWPPFMERLLIESSEVFEGV